MNSSQYAYYLVDGHPYRLDKATLKADAWHVKKNNWNPIEDATDVLYHGREVDEATALAKTRGAK